MTYIDDLLGDQRTFLDELLEEITMNLDNLKRFPENKNYDGIRLFIIYRLMETNYDELIELNENLKMKWRDTQTQMLHCNESMDMVL